MTELTVNTRPAVAVEAEVSGPHSHALFWPCLLDDLHALVEEATVDARHGGPGLNALMADGLGWPLHWHPLVDRWAARIGARTIQLQSHQGRVARSPSLRAKAARQSEPASSARRQLEAHPPDRLAQGPVVRAHSVAPEGFTPRQAHEFHAFCAHFHTALSVHAALDTARQRLAAAYRVIDALPACIALLDERFEPVLLNRPFQEWLARTERLEVRGSVLCMPEQPAALDQALRAFLADPFRPRHSLQLGGLDLQLTRLGGSETAPPRNADAGAHADALADTAAAPGARANVLLQVHERCEQARVREMQTPPPMLACQVQQRFALSDKELQLAWNLAEGLSLKQVASLTDRSVETVRSQLKSVFRKLGTRDQCGIGAVLFEALQDATLQSMGEHLAAVISDRAGFPLRPALSLGHP